MGEFLLIHIRFPSEFDLFQNDSCVMYLKGIIFERSLSILLFEKGSVFREKMFFSVLVTPILPVLLITLTLDCKNVLKC